MKRVGAYAAKTNLSHLLDEVEDGMSFVITRNGKPVARLDPVEHDHTLDTQEAIETIRRIAKVRKVRGHVVQLMERRDA